MQSATADLRAMVWYAAILTGGEGVVTVLYLGGRENASLGNQVTNNLVNFVKDLFLTQGHHDELS